MVRNALTCLAVAAGLLLGVAAAQAASPFEDLPPDHWAYQAVQKLVERGIMEGYADGKFHGERVLTRYELAGILARFLEQLEGQAEIQLTPEESALVERLRREFAAELKMQKDRTAALEVQLREVQGELAQVKKENKELKEQLNRALREVASLKTELNRLNTAGGQDLRARLDQQESSTRRLYLFLAVLAAAVLIK